MAKLGRPRNTRPGDPILPPGVRKVGARYYWQPTNKQEREARRAAGLPLSIALGADLTAARAAWGEQQRAELPPEAGTLGEILARFRDEELPRLKKSGKPRYSAATRAAYGYSVRVFLAAFGTREYAKNELEASRGGKLRRLDLQRWLDAQKHGPQANRHLAALSRAFRCALRWGYTEHNPCLGVERAEELPRSRDVAPWEIQVLLVAAAPARAAAPPYRARHGGWHPESIEPNRQVPCACGCGAPVWRYGSNGQPRRFARGHGYAAGGAMMALMIRMADISGASGQDIRGLRREHLQAAGVAITRGKTGTRRIAQWTPELRAIIDEALSLGPEVRGAVFCNRRGQPYSQGAFQTLWKRTRAKAQALAKAAGLPPLDDLHFHDIRKKAGNDADEQGQSMSDFLGNDPATSRKHYKLRPTKVRPTK